MLLAAPLMSGVVLEKHLTQVTSVTLESKILFSKLCITVLYKKDCHMKNFKAVFTYTQLH